MKKTIRTKLPVFPGFYNTPFDSDDDDQMEIDDINSLRRKIGKEPIEYDDVIFDYDTYHKGKVINCTEKIKELLTGFISDATFIDIDSPKQYNFSNDIVDIDVSLSKENLDEIKKYIYTNKEKFDLHLKQNFTSYDGFCSFFSNNFEDWVEYTKDFSEFDGEYIYLYTILEFIALNEYGYECIINKMLESCSDVYLSAKNYDELTS